VRLVWWWSLGVVVRGQLSFPAGPTGEGVNLLGYKIFYFYKRIKNKNLQNFKEKMKRLQKDYSLGLLTQEKLTQKIRG